MTTSSTPKFFTSLNGFLNDSRPRFVPSFGSGQEKGEIIIKVNTLGTVTECLVVLSLELITLYIEIKYRGS